MININYHDYSPYPELPRSQIYEYLLTKYPAKASMAAIFLSAPTQRLVDNRIAWEDLGVIDVAQQSEYEDIILQMIDALEIQRGHI